MVTLSPASWRFIGLCVATIAAATHVAAVLRLRLGWDFDQSRTLIGCVACSLTLIIVVAWRSRPRILGVGTILSSTALLLLLGSLAHDILAHAADPSLLSVTAAAVTTLTWFPLVRDGTRHYRRPISDSRRPINDSRRTETSRGNRQRRVVPGSPLTDASVQLDGPDEVVV